MRLLIHQVQQLLTLLTTPSSCTVPSPLIQQVVLWRGHTVIPEINYSDFKDKHVMTFIQNFIELYLKGTKYPRHFLNV